MVESFYDDIIQLFLTLIMDFIIQDKRRNLEHENEELKKKKNANADTETMEAMKFHLFYFHIFSYLFSLIPLMINN